MAGNENPYRLELDPDVKMQLERTLCNRVLSAVSAASERNSMLRIWRDQLEGFGVTAQNQLWANACNLCDPISMESFLTIMAQLSSSIQHDPAVEAFRAEDEEGARLLEAWLAMARVMYGVDGRLYDLCYNGAVDPAVVGYVGWCQTTRTKREVGYKEKGQSRVVLDDATEDGADYETVPLAEEVVEERYDIRAVNFSDFYLWPPTVDGVQSATAVAERMYLTSEQLWDGIADYGYDRDAVDELTAMGPPGPEDESRQAEAEIDGLQIESDRDGGIYEVFTMYTRLPRHLPGKRDAMPEYLLQDDFLVVCCPSRNIVLKIAFSPFSERPYFLGGIMPKPGKTQGHGLMGLLEGLQAEANANLQLGIDSSNLVVAPMVTCREDEQEDIVKQKMGPGAVIKVKDPAKSIYPWPINTNPVRDTLMWQTDIRNRARSVVSAEGQGQLQTKVRKNAEVQAVETSASAKFGMYLSNFQRTVIAEVFRRMVALKQQFGDVGEGRDGEDFLDKQGAARKLTATALRGRYNIVATGTSLTHSPEARMEIAEKKQQIQLAYFQLKQAGMQPPDLAFAWHGAREVLYDLGEHKPDAWLGPEPQVPPPQPMMPPGMPGAPPQGMPGGLQPMNGSGPMPPPGVNN